MSTAPAPIFSLQDVAVRFPSAEGEREILRDVTFDVAEGEIVGIVGRSGTGKTTLLRILGALLEPNDGTVLLDGAPLSASSATVATVFQDYGHALLPWRTVARNVALGLEGHLPRPEIAERVAEALAMVGLERWATDFPWRLSGGMQQRVQIARALALRPRVLLMDEPFGALDAMTKAALQDQLLDVQARTGATTILITHDLEEAIYLSDRVFVLRGSPGELDTAVVTGIGRPRDQLTTKELPRYLELRHVLAAALRDAS